MFIELDEAGTPAPLHASEGHLLFGHLREQGFDLRLTSRGVPCTEIHHTEPFCLVWPATGTVSACDATPGGYRVVFGSAWIQDHDRVSFDAVLDREMRARGFSSDALLMRRTWIAGACEPTLVPVVFG